MELDYLYKYPFQSTYSASAGAGKLQLATCELDKAYPYFFEGLLLHPRQSAMLLFVLSKVVSSRFFIPPNMLKRLILERDPVITSGGEMLRFEGFSACCSAYARVDINPEGYDGKITGNGTTNVDFNSPFRSALSSIRDGERISMSVGPDEILMKRGFVDHVERKVKLPFRWIKGFVEVQAYQSKMEHRFTIGKAEAIKFLRSLPAASSAQVVFYVVAAGKGLRLSQTDKAGLKIGGVNRLHLLRDIAPFADELVVYAHPSGESSEWQLRYGGLVFSLTITTEPWRGFSGEGQVLSDLAEAENENIAKVRAALKWQSIVDTNELSRNCDMESDKVRKLLSVLGSRGLVGFDLSTGDYFHRELPFDFELVESIHPRLKAARKLIAESGVKINSKKDKHIEADVKGSGVEHKVKIDNDSEFCTCPWYSKHQSLRGSCKHILAVRIFNNPELEQEAT